MKKILLVLIVIGTFLIGCSNIFENEGTPLHPLLSNDKSRYSLFIVDKIGTYDNEWKENNEIKNVKRIYRVDSLKEVNESYKFLELEKSPAFVVFDTKNLVFKTYSEEELIKFLKSNNP